jgi:hypothetical protein
MKRGQGVSPSLCTPVVHQRRFPELISEAHDVNWLSRNKARNRLGVSEPVFNALITSKLLGYTSATGMVSDQAILSYQQYGTQWGIDERFGPSTRVIGNDIYDSLPAVENIGPQPPATQTHAVIAPANGTPAKVFDDPEKTDTGWIAHFYLFQNYFYFPNATELSLIWPPPLKLSEPRPVPGGDLPVTLYPHPLGYLGLLVVEGLDRPLKGAEKEAYDVAMPLLDELSARYDVPLPVAHSMAVGVPSGIIHLYFPHRPKAKEIGSATEVLPRCPHPQLRDAYALYREAVSSNNPFHAFLTFWKVYEEAVYVRRGWGARHKRSDTKIRQEIFPDLFAFGARPEELANPSEEDKKLVEQRAEQLRGKKFKKARKLLNDPYRVALAHAGKVDAGKPLTGASWEDYSKVATKVPVVRYMANVVLENVRATFDAEVEREHVEA